MSSRAITIGARLRAGPRPRSNGWVNPTFKPVASVDRVARARVGVGGSSHSTPAVSVRRSLELGQARRRSCSIGFADAKATSGPTGWHRRSDRLVVVVEVVDGHRRIKPGALDIHLRIGNRRSIDGLGGRAPQETNHFRVGKRDQDRFVKRQRKRFARAGNIHGTGAGDWAAETPRCHADRVLAHAAARDRCSAALRPGAER